MANRFEAANPSSLVSGFFETSISQFRAIRDVQVAFGILVLGQPKLRYLKLA